MAIVGRLKPLASRLRSRARQLRSKMFPDSRATLAILTIMKNEELNVDEWIAHYIWQGADHLFIIDNGSSDKTVARIEASPHRERITLLLRPEPHRQGYHYRQTFRRERIRRRFRWLMVADADEFWYSACDNSLPAALSRFEGFDVIYARWSQFGCPGQETHPASLRQELTLRHAALGPHKATKWVVRTSSIGNNSLFIHKIRGACSSRTITDTDVLRLNHYMTQSRRFWSDVKMKRGDASTPASDTARTMTHFDEFNSLSVVRDTELADRLSAR